jgi:hypothetical protein
MKDFLLTLLHLAVITAKLSMPVWGPMSDRPSDDQNIGLAPSVPGTSFASRPDIGRSQIAGASGGTTVMNASWVPSGDRAGNVLAVVRQNQSRGAAG